MLKLYSINSMISTSIALNAILTLSSCMVFKLSDITNEEQEYVTLKQRDAEVLKLFFKLELSNCLRNMEDDAVNFSSVYSYVRFGVSIESDAFKVRAPQCYPAMIRYYNGRLFIGNDPKSVVIPFTGEPASLQIRGTNSSDWNYYLTVGGERKIGFSGQLTCSAYKNSDHSFNLGMGRVVNGNVEGRDCDMEVEFSDDHFEFVGRKRAPFPKLLNVMFNDTYDSTLPFDRPKSTSSRKHYPMLVLTKHVPITGDVKLSSFSPISTMQTMIIIGLMLVMCTIAIGALYLVIVVI